MTKKDYILLAQALKNSKITLEFAGNVLFAGTSGQWQATVLEIVDTLQRDNPYFDRNRFLSACGYE